MDPEKAKAIRLRWLRAGALVVLTLPLAGVIGCALLGGGVTAVEVPGEPVGIVGEIKSIEKSGTGDTWGTMLVEGGEQPAGAVSDKAVVTITSNTLITTEGRRILPDDLVVGMTVRVWFEGAVAESYPVQGSASFIEVP